MGFDKARKCVKAVKTLGMRIGVGISGSHTGQWIHITVAAPEGLPIGPQGKAPKRAMDLTSLPLFDPSYVDGSEKSS